MAKNLTTLYLFKLHAGIAAATTTNDTLLVALINSVSESIASWCNRTFELTEYKQWMNGNGSFVLTLDNWPITILKGVSKSTYQVGTIQYTGGSWAAVNISGTTLTLSSLDSSGASTDTEITLSGTINDVKTLVDAVSGWTFSVNSADTAKPAILMNAINGGSALYPDSVDTYIPDTPVAARVVSGTNQQIEIVGTVNGITGQAFNTATRNAGEVDGLHGGGCGQDPYHDDYFSGVDYCRAQQGFPPGQSNVFVWYKAGYTLPAPLNSNSAPTTAGDVPTDLTLICNSIVKEVFDDSKQDGSMKSEKFTNYSYTKADGSAGQMIKDAVNRYAVALTPYVSSRLV